MAIKPPTPYQIKARYGHKIHTRNMPTSLENDREALTYVLEHYPRNAVSLHHNHPQTGIVRLLWGIQQFEYKHSLAMEALKQRVAAAAASIPPGVSEVPEHYQNMAKNYHELFPTMLELKAKGYMVKQIAEELNQQGLKTVRGLPFREATVSVLMSAATRFKPADPSPAPESPAPVAASEELPVPLLPAAPTPVFGNLRGLDPADLITRLVEQNHESWKQVNNQWGQLKSASEIYRRNLQQRDGEIAQLLTQKAQLEERFTALDAHTHKLQLDLDTAERKIVGQEEELEQLRLQVQSFANLPVIANLTDDARSALSTLPGYQG